MGVEVFIRVRPLNKQEEVLHLLYFHNSVQRSSWQASNATVECVDDSGKFFDFGMQSMQR